MNVASSPFPATEAISSEGVVAASVYERLAGGTRSREPPAANPGSASDKTEPVAQAVRAL